MFPPPPDGSIKITPSADAALIPPCSAGKVITYVAFVCLHDLVYNAPRSICHYFFFGCFFFKLFFSLLFGREAGDLHARCASRSHLLNA